MFGLGFGEIVLILVIALIVFGPDKLPEIARTLGKSVGELRRAMDDMRVEFNNSTRIDYSAKETNPQHVPKITTEPNTVEPLTPLDPSKTASNYHGQIGTAKASAIPVSGETLPAETEKEAKKNDLTTTGGS